MTPDTVRGIAKACWYLTSIMLAIIFIVMTVIFWREGGWYRWIVPAMVVLACREIHDIYIGLDRKIGRDHDSTTGA